MSVEGCFTDFHIDFGGTSVWYHILRGGKVSAVLKVQCYCADTETVIGLKWSMLPNILVSYFFVVCDTACIMQGFIHCVLSHGHYLALYYF